jgi:GAF domain-containing protein
MPLPATFAGRPAVHHADPCGSHPAPRFVSYPGDALVETAAVGVVGGAMIWMVETQENEKRLRQKAVLRLRALNAVASILTESLELEQVLHDALNKVLEVMGLQAGLVFILDKPDQELVLAASQGLVQPLQEVGRIKVGTGCCGRVAQTGEPMLVQGDCSTPCLPAVSKAGLMLIVPLKSKGQVQGVLVVATQTTRQFHPDELELATAIGNEIGVAIESAQLHQDVARQLQIEHRLNQVAEEITSELELDNILPKVLKTAQELLGADAGVIALLDRERNLIHYPYLNLTTTKLSVTVPGKSSPGKCSPGRPVIIADYRLPGSLPALPSWRRQHRQKYL